MYAIVLTFDEQVGFAELQYKRYMELWPDCPLIFRIPYNSEDCPSLDFFRSRSNVELVKSGSGLCETMRSLLMGIPDEEWVYWSIDDRYPLEILELETLRELHQSVAGNHPAIEEADRIKLLFWKEKRGVPNVRIGKLPFAWQKRPSMFGFWHHGYLRARVLKRAFTNDHIPEDAGLRLIQRTLHKERHPDLDRDCLSRILVPSRNLIHFWEPCIRRQLTRNGYEDLQKYECPIPSYPRAALSKRFVEGQGRPRFAPVNPSRRVTGADLNSG